VVSWTAVDCAVKYNVQYRKVGTTPWISDTLNGTKDTLKALKANTSYEWKVATICRYPSIIISGYKAGTNFTTPVSLTEISVSSTSDILRREPEMVFQRAFILILQLPVQGCK
jgi:hypothetical protein